MILDHVRSRCELGLSNQVGIKSLQLVAESDFNDLGQIVPASDVYDISFASWSGSFAENSASNQAGEYYTRTAEITIPRYRALATRIIRELKDRRVVVKVVDRNGDIHIIHNARIQSEYSTGSRPGDKSGYRWRFTGQSAGKAFYNFSSIGLFLGGDGYVPGDLSSPAFVPNPTTPGGIDACCITILTTPILFTPEASGNSMHRNKVVTVAATGDKYFIDKLGYAIKLSSGSVIKERVIGTGAAVYNLTLITDAANTIVNRTQNVLKLEAPPGGIADYNIVDGQLILSDDWPLEAGEYVEVYKLAS